MRYLLLTHHVLVDNGRVPLDDVPASDPDPAPRDDVLDCLER